MVGPMLSTTGRVPNAMGAASLAPSVSPAGTVCGRGGQGSVSAGSVSAGSVLGRYMCTGSVYLQGSVGIRWPVEIAHRRPGQLSRLGFRWVYLRVVTCWLDGTPSRHGTAAL